MTFSKEQRAFFFATNVKLRSNCEHAACLGCRRNYENTFSDPSFAFYHEPLILGTTVAIRHVYVKRINALCTRKYRGSPTRASSVVQHLIIFSQFAERFRTYYVSTISGLWRVAAHGAALREFWRVFILLSFSLLRPFITFLVSPSTTRRFEQRLAFSLYIWR